MLLIYELVQPDVKCISLPFLRFTSPMR